MATSRILAQHVDPPRFGIGETLRLLQFLLEMLERCQRMAQEGIDVGELRADVREQPAPRRHVDRHHVEDGDPVGERLTTEIFGGRQSARGRLVEVSFDACRPESP